MNNNNYMKKNNSSSNINSNIFKDENITKYMGGFNSNSNTNNNLIFCKPPTIPQSQREFGKDLTNRGVQNKNIINNSLNNKKIIPPTKLGNIQKPIKKTLIRNDNSLYNLRPRNLPSMNSSRNNSNNNSFSTNNENVNTLNIMNTSNGNMRIEKEVINDKFKDCDKMEVDEKIENSNKNNINSNPPVNNFFSFKYSNKSIIVSNQINSNPQLVSEYLYEIFDHLKETEMNNYPEFGYMKHQPDLNEKMRSILIDWLVDVHLKFKLLPETLFLTTQIIDRFLEKTELNRNKLQLVGVASLFIACKYEEIYPPELKDFVYITDKAYTKLDILNMEKEILNVLDFDITNPSPLVFLDLYLELAQTKIDNSLYYFARYLLELFLIEYKMIKYPQSLIAASTLYIALKVKKNNISSFKKIDVTKLSQYTDDRIKECARDICIILDNADKTSLQAVRTKFSSSKFLEVAKWKKC